MAPAFAVAGDLLGRILRIVNQHVAAASKFAEVAIKLGDAGLVVGGVDDRAAGGVHAIAEAALGMIQPGDGNLRLADFPAVAAGNFAEGARGRHHADVYGEVRAGELGFEDLAKAIGAEGLRLEAAKVEAVLRLEKRMEERNALDVIP